MESKDNFDIYAGCKSGVFKGSKFYSYNINIFEINQTFDNLKSSCLSSYLIRKQGYLLIN